MMEVYLDEVNNSLSEEFGQYFKYLKYISEGSFGIVVHALNLQDNSEVAVKIVDKTKTKLKNLDKLKQEINILSQLKHENIVEFKGYIETNQKLYIVTEYVKEGTLSNFINKLKIQEIKLNEIQCSQIMKSLFSSVEYLHSKEIIHRDIKPENILIADCNDLSTIKLIDFGLSSQFFEEKEEYEYCGTLIYMAPEQIGKRLYTKVCFYLMK